ncbi:MAG: hypothetical protein LBI61_00720 [Puniceicoccales bacterium]|nr:hypothetical protein [Puniceicoccales bacterium]
MCALNADDSMFSYLDCKVGYESEHMNRGRPEMRKSIFAEIELGLALSDVLTTYVGIAPVVAAGLGPASDGRDEVKPYVGLCYDATDTIKLDAGYAHHFYVAKRDSVGGGGGGGQVIVEGVGNLTEQDKYGSSGEIYGGISADVLLSPSIYCFYDFTKREFAIEGNVSHIFDLSDRLLDGLGLKISGKLGYDKPKKLFGIRKSIDNFFDPNVRAFSAKGYAYYGIGADLILSINGNVEASVGVAYEGNSAGKNDAPNAYVNGKRRDAIIFRGGVSCSF